MGAQRSGPVLDKPTALDYAVMFGGPLAFLILAILGIMWLLGPPPQPNPVRLLRDGAVRHGMTVVEVERRLGAPKAVLPRDGGFTYRYQHGSDRPFVEEDGYVDFDLRGMVVGFAVEQRDVGQLPQGQQ
jgi:hypothetical protein